MSVEFDLVIDATEMLDFSGLKNFSQITRAINSLTVEVNEFFSRQLITFQISQRHTVATNEYLTFCFRRAQVVLFVDDVGCRID